MENLDYRRLGKQRIEAKQIIESLENNSLGWSKHPATLSFSKNIDSLKAYYNICIQEWINRGYKCNMKIYDEIDESKYSPLICEFDGKKAIFHEDNEKSYPKFVSFPPYFYAHRASLYRKNNNFYSSKNFPEEYLEKGYFWPSKFDSDDVYENWDINNLEEIGSGAPAQYRISKETVKLWELNKNVNPLTGRKIKKTGNLYKDYLKAQIFYNKKILNRFF